MTGARIRPVEPGDRAAWAELYATFRATGDADDERRVAETVWAWIEDDTAQTRCLVAENGGDRDGDGDRLVGLAHFRVIERPMYANTAIWLDDVYVHPDARGAGIGAALIRAVAEIAEAEGRALVRWSVHEDNPARRLYDREAQRSPVAIYTRWIEEKPATA